MSPEQVRESVVDHRSDLFSFGVVLYEMLTGVRPCAGDSPAALAASILPAEPAPMGGARRTGALEAVARRCLQKRPADRYPSADAIEQALSTPTGEAPAPLPLDPRLTTASLSTDARRSVAVLPFVDLSLDQSLEFFCDGVAEEILDALSRVPGLRVAARSSSFQFRGRAGDARTIGQTLNVGTALEGSVRASGRRLRITTQLVDTDGGFQVWSARFDRELDDIFAVQDEIARAVVGALQVPQGETKLTALFGAGTTDLEAYTLYLKGRHHWNKRTEADLATAESYFEQALSRDPAYAEAQGALAQTLVTHGLYGTRAPADVMPQARAAARAALARQPALPSALATAACVDAVHGWDWEAAATAFQQGIALCPDAPTLHHWYAINCLVPQRRFAEARTELEVALVADPLSPAIVATLGLHGYFARHYESAETELRRALALHSDFAMAHLFLGLTCADTGRMDEARREVQEAAQLSPDSPEMTSAQGYVAARAGDDEAARGCLGALRAAAGHRYVSPVLMAQVHAALGETGEALTWIERAREVRAADLAWSLLRPVWDPLRAEPRFTAVRRAMHLAESDAV
jgi:serine/threonine-protein kinase